MGKNPLRLCVDEVNSIDMYRWRANFYKLTESLKIFCSHNGITFTYDLTKDIVSLDSKELLITWHSDLLYPLTYYEELNELCKNNHKTLGIVTENCTELKNLSNIKFYSDKQLLGYFAIYNDQPLQLSSPSKLYNCLMQRGDPLRQNFLYWIKHFDLLDQGYVSYLCVSGAKEKEKIISPKEIYQSIHANDSTRYEFRPPAISELTLPPDVEKIYNYFEDQIPYRNFPEKYDLCPITQDSKYSVVLETFAPHDNWGSWSYTEKALRPLQLATIPLLYVQKNGILKLSNMGFAIPNFYSVFDSLDFQQRQSAILDIVLNDSIDIPIQTLIDNAQHNRALVQSWLTQLQKEQYWEELFVDFCSTTC